MARIHPKEICSFADCVARWARGSSKACGCHGIQLTGNTWLRKRDEDTFVIQFHATAIVIYRRNGSIQLFNGGYMTLTTKTRINRFTPAGFHIYQNKYQWYVQHNDFSLNPEVLSIVSDAFVDGMTFDHDYHLVAVSD